MQRQLKFILDYTDRLLIAIFIAVYFVVPNQPIIADLLLVFRLLIGMLITLRWERAYLFIAGSGLIITAVAGSFNIRLADQTAGFVVLYFGLFIAIKYIDYRWPDNVFGKLIRPVMLYINWYDVYRVIFHKFVGEDFRYVLRNGIHYNSAVTSSDYKIIDEIWGSNMYLKHGVHVNPGDTVVDIGAYIGDFTVYASRAVKNGKVFAFEPSPNTYKYLMRNVRENNCKNVILNDIAIGSKNGKVTLFRPANGEFGSSTFDIRDMARCDRIVVSVKSLKVIMTKYSIVSIDLLKLDCEGGEYDILLTLPIGILHSIKQISLEYHQMKGHSVSELYEFLSHHGFIVSVEKSNKYIGYLYASRKSE